MVQAGTRCARGWGRPAGGSARLAGGGTSDPTIEVLFAKWSEDFRRIASSLGRIGAARWIASPIGLLGQGWDCSFVTCFFLIVQ